MVFNLARGQQVRGSSYDRVFKSPPFSFANSSAIATSGASKKFLFDYHRDNKATEKYGSYNNVRIFNNSQSAILVYPNQDTNLAFPVFAGTSATLGQEIISGTTSLLVENIGTSSISANELRVTIWKDITEVQSIASRLHEKFFSGQRNPFGKINQTNLGFRKKLGSVL